MEKCNKFNIKKLNLYYGNFQALNDINMEIAEKEITSFIGPSGCGKSTFLRCLNRMNDLIDDVKIDGEILLDQRNIVKEVEILSLRKRVGMVFQKPNPFPMSIYDNIAYGPRAHGIKKKSDLDDIVENALKKAAVWEETREKLRKSALAMSGGQQQRICIARALAIEPEVLLMDEPTSALDPISTLKIEELALNLKEKYTIVMVTHNMQQAARVSKNTAFFLMGKVVEYNETEIIFNNPKETKTEDYITGRFG
ncbi:MAG: phosphate ABC transporter ATP-binding protein PstB [Lachnospirales bacterium]